jgi:hypothetical protein
MPIFSRYRDKGMKVEIMQLKIYQDPGPEVRIRPRQEFPEPDPQECTF